MKTVDVVASQYKQSEKLIALIDTEVKQCDDVDTALVAIPSVLELERAESENLDLIGKIVGVNRRYCGNFSSTLNYSIQKNSTQIGKVTEIELTDKCMKKLIKVKIIKNKDGIVNYKKLAEILTEFMGVYIEIKTCGDFSIRIKSYKKDDGEQFLKCLILLRGFLPLPPTIKLYYDEDITSYIKTKDSITTSFRQHSSVFVQKPPVQTVHLDTKDALTAVFVQVTRPFIRRV